MTYSSKPYVMDSTEKPTMELLNYKITHIQEQLNKIEDGFEKKIVLKDEFELRVGRIESIVYGISGIVGTAIVGSLIALILK